MAFQSEIELRVKVIDKELNELEKRIQKVQNPFSASGASKGASKAELRQRQVLLNVDKNRLELQQRLKADQIKQLNITNNWLKVLRQGEEVRKDIAAAAEREAKATQKTAAAAQKAAKTKRNRGLQSAALGVGFPLLFGGGAGSIAGGLLGSAGGFGGQILGSAIGQQIDNAVQGIAKLGQALNPLTADLDAVIKAAGKTGSETEKLIKRLEDLGNEEAALEAATAQLAILVGQNGVDALKEFGEDAVEFGNEVSRALTVVGASIATIINAAGILKGITDALAFDTDLKRGIANRNNDAELGRLYNERGNPDLARIDADATEVQNIIRGIDEAIVARQRQLDIEAQITAQQKTQKEIQAQIKANNAPELQRLQAQLELEESGLDLTTQKGVQAALAAKSKELDSKVQGEIEKGVSKEVLQLRRKLALLKIVNQAKEEQRRKDEEDRRKAEAANRKARQTEAAIKGATVQALRADLAFVTSLSTRELAIQAERANIQQILDLQIEQLRLTTEDNRLLYIKERTLVRQADTRDRILERELFALRVSERRLQIEKDIARQSQLTGIDRQIERIDIGTGPGSDEQLLALDQRIRREDALIKSRQELATINDKILALDATSTDQEYNNLVRQRDAQIAFNQSLQERLNLLDQAEQAQFRYNQVLEAAAPFAEAFATGLTQGLRDVVAGTKTAEEAFADFLNTVADQLIQTAATMIAQYIAIGIARAFAGLGGGSSGTDFSQFGTNTTGVPTNFIKPAPFQYAEGGYVTGPQPAIVGEGGEPEYIIPASKMSGAMARYSAGTRGEAVIDGDGSSASGASEASGAVIDVNYSVERINNVEYVTNAEFQRGMTAAAKQGAELGRKQVYGDLINKRSVRSRLSI